MAFFSQNALFSVLRLLGLASALLAIVFVINNFLIFGVDTPGLINTLRLGDALGVGLGLISSEQFVVRTARCVHHIEAGCPREVAISVDREVHILQLDTWETLRTVPHGSSLSFLANTRSVIDFERVQIVVKI